MCDMNITDAEKRGVERERECVLKEKTRDHLLLVFSVFLYVSLSHNIYEVGIQKKKLEIYVYIIQLYISTLASAIFIFRRGSF